MVTVHIGELTSRLPGAASGRQSGRRTMQEEERRVRDSDGLTDGSGIEEEHTYTSK
jgi:hypothetical protein